MMKFMENEQFGEFAKELDVTSYLLQLDWIKAIAWFKEIVTDYEVALCWFKELFLPVIGLEGSDWKDVGIPKLECMDIRIK